MVFGRLFHLMLDRLGIRRFREHTFFGSLLPQAAIVADFGAHRGEFFTALKSEYSISRALLVEANPALAELVKKRFGPETKVLHAALVGENRRARITFTRSTNPECSSIFREWAAASGITDRVDVPAVPISKLIRELGGQVDLLKFDVEGAEIDVLEKASACDLASCSQLTVEFHDGSPPLTPRDVQRVCKRMRSEGYALVNANWPYTNDILFVNLKTMVPSKRLTYRCRVVLVNALFIARRVIFDRSFVKRIRWNELF
jgi:FkbM family methyltransferase